MAELHTTPHGVEKLHFLEAHSHRHIIQFIFQVSCYTMVQGKTKGLQSKAPRRPTKAATNLKKGKKYIAPKKPALVKQASVHKVAVFLPGGCILS